MKRERIDLVISITNTKANNGVGNNVITLTTKTSLRTPAMGDLRYL
jgi:hypothetical protein